MRCCGSRSCGVQTATIPRAADDQRAAVDQRANFGIDRIELVRYCFGGVLTAAPRMHRLARRLGSPRSRLRRLGWARPCHTAASTALGLAMQRAAVRIALLVGCARARRRPRQVPRRSSAAGAVRSGPFDFGYFRLRTAGERTDGLVAPVPRPSSARSPIPGPLGTFDSPAAELGRCCRQWHSRPSRQSPFTPAQQSQSPRPKHGQSPASRMSGNIPRR